MKKHKPKNTGKEFAKRNLQAYLSGMKLLDIEVKIYLDRLEIPNNLTIKERLSYFQLIEMDKDEN